MCASVNATIRSFTNCVVGAAVAAAAAAAAAWHAFFLSPARLDSVLFCKHTHRYEHTWTPTHTQILESVGSCLAISAERESEYPLSAVSAFQVHKA